MLSFIGEFIGDLLGIVFDGLLGDRIVRRRGDKLARDGKVDCGLRTISGSHPLLTGSWSHGTAVLSAGVIHLGPVVVRIEELDADAPRRPTGREVWWVNPDTAVVRVRASSGAVLEWAVLVDRLPWALQQVQDA